ncbi:chromosome segregation protein [Neomicrococcus aestuarii]|uniref:Chromosome partition protein Smc n=1 Tax=Neomicrococcus aestuarii TaxID=556325 RepID=A0A7W8TU50_9MICC|nr:chromosome segregation protein SMC [Neomicrococcus aestuarii]MBB5512125.1 chromosome segregation protein [Neomicrococcus aestuarii]
MPIPPVTKAGRLHLKTLTIRGFKSFASATTFEFEPGVTAVVGPNGSGKSNVVDALAWVMGEQGAKSLRGGKMEDVIFAGTTARSPLGRAHVALTIDNSDNALPIEYSEVTISRTLFRTGGSEYSINGNPCRLLDIQELLSDSGLGREMHVIVGQGQLDRVLHATPEERRGFIEEASGILKHRRRREKAVRKLDAMQTNLHRVEDLTKEIRRQLGPLGRQAEVAKRAQTVQFDVRDAKARLMADDIETAIDRLMDLEERSEAAAATAATLEGQLASAHEELQKAQEHAKAANPAVKSARATHEALKVLAERYAALVAVSQERANSLHTQEASPRRDELPQLEAAVERLSAELESQQGELEAAQEALEQHIAARGAAEHLAAEEEKRLTNALRAQADRREGLAKIRGTIAALEGRLAGICDEEDRLTAELAENNQRRVTAEQEFQLLENSAVTVESGENNLDETYEAAEAQFASLDEELSALRAEQVASEKKRSALVARIGALEESLERALPKTPQHHEGAQQLAAALSVSPGWELAIEVALGPAAGALIAEDSASAINQVRRALAEDSSAFWLIPQDETSTTTLAEADGISRALDHVSIPPELSGVVVILLENTYLADSVDAAADFIAANPQARVITRQGALLTRAYAATGLSQAGSGHGVLELKNAIDSSRQESAEVTASHERRAFALASLSERHRVAQEQRDEALAALHESDAEILALEERLAQLGATIRRSISDAERATGALERNALRRAEEEEKLRELQDRLNRAEAAPAEEAEEPSRLKRDELAAAAAHARAAEVDARLALRGHEEIVKNLSGRLESAKRRVSAERIAISEEQRRVAARIQRAQRAADVASTAELIAAHVRESVLEAETALADAEQQAAAQQAHVQQVQKTVDGLRTQVAEAANVVHHGEVEIATWRARTESLAERALEELSMSADYLVENYGPDQPVDGGIYVRAEQEARLKRAEKDLASLGKVNPLALEEFAALEERHQFISTQLADLQASRRDLLEMIRDVDRHVEEVFAEAYADTAREFERIFARLFPGGEGSLALTDPDNVLTSGIEVNARPAGKNVKRLSLLSGGERSLTAAALLVAIFKARPSPFYVMDEVEAALDDANLGRLITIFEELRESSQLIIITHQKRTMEIADALYGVSMRGDGVSAVMSQRLSRDEDVSA